MNKQILRDEIEKSWENPKLIDAGATIAEHIGKNELKRLQLPLGIVATTGEELAQLESKAVEQERERIVKKYGFKEALPTHINDREIDGKNPLLQFIKGRESVRKELRESLLEESKNE